MRSRRYYFLPFLFLGRVHTEVSHSTLRAQRMPERPTTSGKSCTRERSVETSREYTGGRRQVGYRGKSPGGDWKGKVGDPTVVEDRGHL